MTRYGEPRWRKPGPVPFAVAVPLPVYKPQPEGPKRALQQIIDLLNDAVKTDREAMEQLLLTPVPCNEAMLDHPTIVCWGPEETVFGKPGIGLGGLLMAIGKIVGGGIASVWTDDKRLEGFVVYEPTQTKEECPG